MAGVYVIQEGGTTEAMSRIRCRDENKELQQILEANADLLPGDQIDPDDPRRWLLIKREMSVPDPTSGADRWSIDFLFADQDAIPTFVECKRFDDTRSRREVVGQMLEYAANGHFYWTAEALRDVASVTATQAGRSLEERFASLQPNIEQSVDSYFKLMEKNLREGQLRIVFFLEESPPELRSVVDFLNRQMERSEVLLVEARQYTHAGTTIVVPTLFGYTEEARFVKSAVNVSAVAGRKRWDRSSYLADVESRLGAEKARVVEALLDHCNALECDVTWGAGIQRGSFNLKDPSICQRSLITCYSNGDLVFNFHWLNGNETAERASSRLKELIKERLGLPILEAGTAIPIGDWLEKEEAIAGVLRQLVCEMRMPKT